MLYSAAIVVDDDPLNTALRRLNLNFVECFITEARFAVRDAVCLRGEIQQLAKFGVPIVADDFSHGHVTIDIGDGTAVWAGGDDTSPWPQVQEDDQLIRLDALPPDNWSQIEKEGHAAAHGYPVWIRDVFEDACTFSVPLFLQRHIAPGEWGALIHNWGEGLRSCGSTLVVFDKDHFEYQDVFDEIRTLREKLETARGEKFHERKPNDARRGDLCV